MNNFVNKIILNNRLLPILFIYLIGVLGFLFASSDLAAQVDTNEKKVLQKDSVNNTLPKGIDIDEKHLTEIIDLLRSTILMVNQSNISDDYGKLYSNLTVDVQRKVSIEQLRNSLKGFRQNNLDMSEVSSTIPKFAKLLKIDSDGTLILRGYFPTQPLIFRFDIKYRKQNEQWQLEQIVLDSKKIDLSMLEDLEKKIPLETSDVVRTNKKASNSPHPVRNSSKIYSKKTLSPNLIERNIDSRGGYIEPPITTEWQ